MGRIYRIVRDENTACCGVANDEEKGDSPGSDDKLRDSFSNDWNEIPPAELIERLSCPNGWWRDTAQRILVHRSDENLRIDLLHQLVMKSPVPATRLQALCTLVGLQSPSSFVFTAGSLEDPHPAVRRHAARLLATTWHLLTEEDRSRKDWSKSNRKLAQLINDPDHFVRLQIGYQADQVDPAVAAELILQRGDDKELLAAVFSSLHSSTIDGVLRNMRSRSKSKNRAMIRRLTVQAAALGRFDIVARQLTQQGKPLFENEWTASLKTIADLLAEIRTHGSVWKLFEDSDEWQNSSMRSHLKFLAAHAQQFVKEPTQPDSSRIVGIRFLSASGQLAGKMLDWLSEELNAQNSPNIQAAIVEALGQSNDSRVPELLLERWSIMTPNIRRQIVDTLLARSDWTLQLLEAIGEGQLAGNQLDAAQRERLVTHRDARIRERAVKMFDAEASSDRQAIVEDFAPALSLSGDDARGRVVFEKRCSSCHRLRGIGKSIGADLAALKDRTGKALLTAILDPNRAVEAKFLSYTAVTNAGKTVSGMLLSETGNGVTLVSTDGKEHVLLRQDLDQLISSQRSLMPEGLEKDLSQQDIADVIAFVQRSGQKPKDLPFNSPAIVRPGDDGSIVLPATTASVFGPNLIVEEHFRNLGNWLNENDHAVWNLELPAGKDHASYDAEFDFACHRSAAGNMLVLSVAGQTLEGRVPSTNRWDRYSTWNIGTLTLPPGASRLVVFTRSPPVQALIDLREIRLVPRDQ